MKLDKSRWNGCPIRYSAEIIADKWTFLILRDLMFRGKSSYNALLKSSESISTNILANRLLKLEQHSLLIKTKDPDNKKQYLYTLTEKGFDLIPVMLKLFEWSLKYDENTFLTKDFVDMVRNNPDTMKEKFKAGKVLVLDSRES